MINKFREWLGRVALIAVGAMCLIAIAKFKEFSDYKKIIANLSADSRVADVLVTESKLDEATGLFVTTVKFLEYDVDQSPLTPKYFTFHGNQIQFQALVARFKDDLVKSGNPFKGKSVYLFLKAFVLNGADTESFPITPVDEVPEGYEVKGASSKLQKQIWQSFWRYALDPSKRDEIGLKNAQLEAPGSVFVPGTIYTVRIEHDGGLRIDTAPIPEILKGETIAP